MNVVTSKAFPSERIKMQICIFYSETLTIKSQLNFTMHRKLWNEFEITRNGQSGEESQLHHKRKYVFFQSVGI